MGIDNLEEQKDASSASSADQEQVGAQSGGSEPEGGNAANPTRMDAAKAFFRAMYAGDEPAPDQQTSAPPADSRRIQQLEAQVRECEQRASDAEGNYKRLMADFENFRRRIEREREEYTNIGIKKAAEAFIQGLDDLDRAMLYLTPETPTEKLIESFKLVGSRIFSCLEQAGVKRMNTKGVEFDPRVHEPVMQVETEEHPDNTIVQELRAGYFIGEKVLRPALVSVASNSLIPAPSVVAARAEAEAAARAAAEAAAKAAEAAAEAAARAAEEKAARAAEQAAKEAAALESMSVVPELEKSSSSEKAETAGTTDASKKQPPQRGEADSRGVYDLGDLDDV